MLDCFGWFLTLVNLIALGMNIKGMYHNRRARKALNELLTVYRDDESKYHKMMDERVDPTKIDLGKD